ncbi:MAG TPA: hypothetical protein VLV89_12295 [Candidatus Acidoferrum sp.]|nr:hypothetical protein [Candidatus Acidoferrum sp.]
MTLIATFRSPSAIALCADSQETVTEYDDNGQPYDLRVTVQKISPIIIGKYQIAIAGAGNASLIEAFIERARRAVKDQDAAICTPEYPASVAALRNKLEEELRKFYSNDIALYPYSDKGIQLFIAGCCPIAQQYAMWASEGILLRDAQSPELIGWKHTLYIETAKRVSSDGMTIAQAALASIHTLTLAKQTSNYVRDPLSLAVINKDGIWTEPASYVRRMEERLHDYEIQLNRLFLACSDTTVSVPVLEDIISDFKNLAMSLHREHIDQQAERMNLGDMFSNDPLRKLPGGLITYGTKGLTVEHDREKLNQAREKFESMREPPYPQPFSCSGCGEDFEYLIGINPKDAGRIFVCPDCGMANRDIFHVRAFRKAGAIEWTPGSKMPSAPQEP